MEASPFLQSIAVLATLSLVSADGLTLSLEQPHSSDPSLVTFTCYDGELRAATATFLRNGEEITDQVSVIIKSGGTLLFRIFPGQHLGGTFTCTDHDVTSNAITLPGEL